jgi:hypothetical protein
VVVAPADDPDPTEDATAGDTNANMTRPHVDTNSSQRHFPTPTPYAVRPSEN